MTSLRKGFAHLFLVLVIVVAGVGVLGYFAFKNGQVSLPGETDTTTPASFYSTDVVDETTNSTSDVFTNWNTYHNARFGYLIEYPDNWMLEREETDKQAFKSLVQLGQVEYKTLPSFSIVVSSQPYSSFFSNSMQQFQMTDSVIVLKDEIVTGAGESDYFVNIIFERNNNVFNIQASFVNPPDPAERREFEKILSTFEFI